MEHLFILTRDALVQLGDFTGLSYKEINVLVWYFLIPFSWSVLFDLILGRHFGKAVVGVGGVLLIAVVKYTNSANWIFDQSAEFLLASNVGGNYVNASVVICLFVPMLIYAIMIPWACVSVWKRRRKRQAIATQDG